MHHHRRKSGHASANTSMTDVRKAAGTAGDATSKHSKSSRPAPMTRRTTPSTVTKLGKNPRDREREWEEERWWEEERESFPQYCMACEKQFVPRDDRFVYCSEECRIYDEDTASASTGVPRSRTSNSPTLYPLYSAAPEPRDIVPRAAPSRPTSTHISSPPVTPNVSSAISSLRSLSIRPPSPPSPTGTYHPSLWPFTRSAATSPGTSLTRQNSGVFPSTYDGGYYTGTTYMVTSPTVERPLTARKKSTYSRPKSIELVTPMVGR